MDILDTVTYLITHQSLALQVISRVIATGITSYDDLTNALRAKGLETRVAGPLFPVFVECSHRHKEKRRKAVCAHETNVYRLRP